MLIDHRGYCADACAGGAIEWARPVRFLIGSVDSHNRGDIHACDCSGCNGGRRTTPVRHRGVRRPCVPQHRQLIALSTCWVALDDESRPQGFLSAERYGEALHIHEVSVALSWQGQGLGRRLIEVAQDYARSNGLRLITLTTFIDVPWNAPFYASMGFQAKATQDLEPRLATILNAEYQRGYAPGSRCAMVWSVT